MLIDLPPEAGAISEVHIWIGVHADGREAMLSADMPMRFGVRHSPLMSSRRDLAERLGELARHIQSASPGILRVELRTYRAV